MTNETHRAPIGVSDKRTCVDLDIDARILVPLDPNWNWTLSSSRSILPFLWISDEFCGRTGTEICQRFRVDSLARAMQWIQNNVPPMGPAFSGSSFGEICSSKFLFRSIGNVIGDVFVCCFLLLKGMQTRDLVADYVKITNTIESIPYKVLDITIHTSLRYTSLMFRVEPKIWFLCFDKINIKWTFALQRTTHNAQPINKRLRAHRVYWEKKRKIVKTETRTR